MKGRLTQKFVESAQPGRYPDKSGTGLILFVGRTGARSWVQRTVVHGKQVDIGLGSCRRVRLADARKRAFDNWCIARDGGDPRRTQSVATFAAGMEATIALLRPTWKNAKTEGIWRATLAKYAAPLIDRPLDAITTGDVLMVLSPIWHSKPQTAQRVRQRISRIMDWSVANGHRLANPAGPALSAALPKQDPKVEHVRTTGYEGAGAAVRAVRATGAWWATVAAFEFLTLTATRSGEVRGMRWEEVDGDVWTVPAERMKAGRAHRVPLSTRALEVLEEAAQYRDSSGLVFRSKSGGRMADSTISRLCNEQEIGGTPHGMRSAFRDWANERTSTPHAVMEAALAHKVRNRAEAAYSRSDHLEKRRGLMEAWARHVMATDAKIVRIA